MRSRTVVEDVKKIQYEDDTKEVMNKMRDKDIEEAHMLRKGMKFNIIYMHSIF